MTRDNKILRTKPRFWSRSVRGERKREDESCKSCKLSHRWQVRLCRVSPGQRLGQICHRTNEPAATETTFQLKPSPSKLHISKLQLIIKTQGYVMAVERPTCDTFEPDCGQQTLVKLRSRPNVSHCLMLLYLAFHALASAATATATERGSEMQTLPMLIRAPTKTGHNHWAQSLPANRRESTSERYPLDQLSSADLPAEFRGPDDDDNNQAGSAPKEQSRLEKLCVQTSSVLAAVLPAPFGGHKRSVLCQFFANLPMQTESQRKLTEQPKPIPRFNEPVQSVAVLHQQQQAPVSLLTSGRHPIQLVLEHQHRQLLTAQQYNQRVAQQSAVVVPHNGAQDLKSSASVVDFAYHQKLEPPPDMIKPKNTAKVVEKLIKFNAPAASASFKPMMLSSSSPLMSTSGWRILNQTLQTTVAPKLVSASTQQLLHVDRKSVSKAVSTFIETSTQQVNLTKVTPISRAPANIKRLDELNMPETVRPKNITNPTDDLKKSMGLIESTIQSNSSIQLLVLGKPPPSFNMRQSAAGSSQTILDKRSEELKTTTKSLNTKLDPSSLVRTIEVTAQNNNCCDSKEGPSTSAPASSSTTQRPAADLRQVQKREELVIASINNLTRIAFGNQLRDTVKVINKLIDQQANLFRSDNGSSDQMSATGKRQSTVVIVEESKLINQQSNGSSSTTFKSNRTKEKSDKAQQTLIKSEKRPKKIATVAGTKLQRSSTASYSAKKVARTSAAKMRDNLTELTLASSASEPRRLHAKSRTSSKHEYSSRSTRAMNESNPLFQATTMRDIRRGNLHLKSNERGLTTLSVDRSSSFRNTVTSSPIALGKRATQLNSGNFTWLIPDKGSYPINLFDVSDHLSADVTISNLEPHSKWVAQSESPKQHNHGLGSTTINLETTKLYTPKLDSLTTLKMSLTTKSDLPIAKSTSQTKWVPTTAISSTPIPLATATSSPTYIKLTTTKSTSIPITTEKLSTYLITSTSSPSDEVSVRPASALSYTQTPIIESIATTQAETSYSRAYSHTTPVQDELNEAKASETISRYTTHWSEANEQLATTKRLYQQLLPQVVNTGEFFSAETIANWPERYHVSVGRALENAKSTTPYETTRRAGESYEPDSVLASRHRIAAASDARSTRRSESAVNLAFSLPSFTVLPSNHKLATTSATEVQSTTPIQDQTPQRSRETTTGKRVSEQAAYTLVGPYTDNDSDSSQTPFVYQHSKSTVPDKTVNAKIPQAVGSVGYTNGGGLKSHLFSSNLSSALRPPYLEPLPDDTESDSDQQLTSKHRASKKLYELLVSSNQNFVGAQNPTNHQRFNLSALKFLAQNLLSPSNYHDETVMTSKGNDNSSQGMVDSIGAALPSSYYDLLSTDASESSANRTAPQAKSIMSRASNFLNDLRHLEHKKAAAVLAAIRYQVPSPLVRPWDFASDSQDEAKRLSDRLDTLNERIDLASQLLLSPAAVRAVLTKQRLVPRDELEDRLNQYRQINDSPERRSNQLAYVDLMTNHNESILNKTRARSFDSEMFHDDLSEQVGGSYSSRNLSKILLERLLRPTAQRLVPKLLRKSYEGVHNQNGSSDDMQLIEEFDSKSEQQYPRYIQSNDYRTLLGNLGSAKIKPLGIHLSSSLIAAKLKSNSALSDKVIEPKDDTSSSTIDEQDETEQQLSKGSNFSCSGRQAGFYPDVESACQAFYHCSNTEHLLTFNCPKQTRFDEKILRCGPWFEVPCDLNKINQRKTV